MLKRKSLSQNGQTKYESHICQALPIVLYCWNKKMFNSLGQRRSSEAPPRPISASYDRRQTKIKKWLSTMFEDAVHMKTA